MSSHRWLQNLRSALASAQSQRQHRRWGSLRAATHRPTLEVLEDRCLLSFSPAVSYPVDLYPQAVATGLFNADTRLDLVVANYTGNSVSVLLGNADGTFQSALTSATGGGPLSLAVGDFNDDGNLDLATANAGDVSVLLGNGDGTFAPPSNTAIGSSPQSVAVGDFNADGKLDLGVTSNVYYPGTPGSWVCYHGWYDDYCTYYPGSPGYYEGRATVLLGNGDGSFSAPNTTGLGYGYHTSAAVANFNADTINGHPVQDFATVNLDNGTVSVLLGDVSGYLQGPTDFSTGAYPWSVATGDVDADGDTDLVTANIYSNEVSVLPGDGLGAFGPAQNFATGGGPASVVLRDFNNDGHLDIATANSFTDDMSVLRGVGDGTFLSALSSAAGSGPWGLAAGDFNGDLFPDVAVANPSSNNVSVLLNTQDWRFFLVSGFPSPATAGEAHSVTVTARDTSGDVLTGYTGTVHFASSDPQAVLPADYTFTAADHGTHTFTLALKTAGTQSLTVTDTTTPGFTGSQGGIVVNPAAPRLFVVAGTPSPMTSGDSGYFSVSAYDAYGNLATNYTGTVHFTSSDGSATLPADYTFAGSNYGTASFSATLRTAGTQSLTATDTLNPSATGTETGIRVLPRVTITGPSYGARYQTLTFTLGGSGGSSYAYAIDWDNDGLVDQTVSGPSGTAVQHSYSVSGVYSVGVTATVRIGAEDYTGARAYQAGQILAVSVTIQTDPGEASKSALVVEGTANGETIVLSPGTGSGVALSYNGTSVGTIAAPGGATFGHVFIYGYAGNDTLRLTGGLSVPALLLSGDGNDTIDASGSSASNVLVGGAGTDALTGGSGRDLLIGGPGADTVRGGGGDDILIGGHTDYDANAPALLAIMKEWGRTDVDYNTRVRHLSGSLSGGWNVVSTTPILLTASTVHATGTVNDDSAVDSLYGDAGTDWFFARKRGSRKDRVNDLGTGEVVTEVS
jgi:hypothetical protein